MVSPKKFIFLPDIAIADVAFEAYGKTLNELFDHAAEATCSLMVEFSTIQPRITKEISLTTDTIEKLLFDFLSEIIFLKDAERILFCSIQTTITEENKKIHLKATLKGDKINPQQQKLGSDVKAVTYHLFEVKKDDKLYKARVILDI